MIENESSARENRDGDVSARQRAIEAYEGARDRATDAL